VSGRVKSFEDWIAYVFDHPVTNPAWHFKDIGKDDWEPSEELAVEYLTRFFKNPESALLSFSNAQVNQGLKYLISPSCSSHMFALLEMSSVSWEKRKEAIASMHLIFERYFVLHCDNTLSHLNQKGAPLNNVCYMWWDDFPYHGHPKEPQYAKLDDAVLSEIEKILLIPHVACQESALHGLGHWKLNYPKRVTKTIESFLARNPDLRPELKEYALRARSSRVQ
jgi:hypothetical protein